MSKLETLRRKWREDPAFRSAYDALEEEFTLIEARSRAELTQEEMARRMKTSQAYVAKMEGSRVNPSVETLKRFAAATGRGLRITFEPDRRSD